MKKFLVVKYVIIIHIRPKFFCQEIMPPKITQEKITQIIELREFGCTFNDICKITKITDIRKYTRNLLGKYKISSHVNGFILER